jgi:DNA-directed RNA polymerase subunit RPC12/RpoP
MLERKISEPTRITCPTCGKMVRLPAPEDLQLMRARAVVCKHCGTELWSRGQPIPKAT